MNTIIETMQTTTSQMRRTVNYKRCVFINEESGLHCRKHVKPHSHMQSDVIFLKMDGYCKEHLLQEMIHRLMQYSKKDATLQQSVEREDTETGTPVELEEDGDAPIREEHSHVEEDNAQTEEVDASPMEEYKSQTEEVDASPMEEVKHENNTYDRKSGYKQLYINRQLFYVCDEQKCGKMYKRRGNLTRHRRNTHILMNPAFVVESFDEKVDNRVVATEVPEEEKKMERKEEKKNIDTRVSAVVTVVPFEEKKMERKRETIHHCDICMERGIRKCYRRKGNLTRHVQHYHNNTQEERVTPIEIIHQNQLIRSLNPRPIRSTHESNNDLFSPINLRRIPRRRLFFGEQEDEKKRIIDISSSVHPQLRDVADYVFDQTTVNNLFQLDEKDVIDVKTMKNKMKEKVELNENCGICMSSLGKKTCQILSCMHVFHNKCIDKWFNMKLNQSCPYCRVIPTQRIS